MCDANYRYHEIQLKTEQGARTIFCSFRLQDMLDTVKTIPYQNRGRLRFVDVTTNMRRPNARIGVLDPLAMHQLQQAVVTQAAA